MCEDTRGGSEDESPIFEETNKPGRCKDYDEKGYCLLGELLNLHTITRMRLGINLRISYLRKGTLILSQKMGLKSQMYVRMGNWELRI